MEFMARFWRSPLLWSVAIVPLTLLSLFSTGCSMLSVPTATPTKTPTTIALIAAPVTVVFVTPTTPAPTLTAAPSAVPTGVPTATNVVTATEVVESEALPARPDDVNPLTGLKVADKSVLQRRPLLVRVGNDAQIRPQTGLSSADVVYEDVMDGWWVTRFTGIFLSQDLEAVGPIRSARLVNLQMAPQYDGGLVHSGASDPIRWRLSQSTIVDLDEFFTRTPYFYKQGADWRGRLFVNLKLIRKYLEQKKLEKPVQLRGFVFDGDGTRPPAGAPATEITIPYPKSSTVSYKYDAASGLYRRYVQSVPHLDAVTNQQLTAANVVVQFCPHEKTDIVEDSQGTTSINITLLGEGPALVFRNGVAQQAHWKTDNPGRMTRFLDKDGQAIAFKPGQTWIELAPPDYVISTTAGALGPSVSAAAVTGTAPLTGTGVLTLTLPLSAAAPATGSAVPTALPLVLPTPTRLR
jgi:hypothetical protein